MKRFTVPAAVLLSLAALAGTAAAHCQIPCGIFDDELRVRLLEEDITTIEKSMTEIASLSGKTPVNYNQLVRWVNNKEEHAAKIADLASYYFLAQRVKAPAATSGEEYQKYVTQVTLLHQILTAATKAKQTTDLTAVATLRDLVARFRVAYFGPEGGHSH